MTTLHLCVRLERILDNVNITLFEARKLRQLKCNQDALQALRFDLDFINECLLDIQSLIVSENITEHRHK